MSGLTDGPRRERCGVTLMVSNRAIQRASHDHLLAVEEKCLSTLVERVHDEGMRGEAWPTVERTPMRWSGGAFGVGQLIECGEGQCTEWRVTAWCMAVPR